MAYISGQDVGAVLDLFSSRAYPTIWILGLAIAFLSLIAASICLMRRAESFRILLGAVAGLIAGISYFALALGALPESDARATRSTSSPTTSVETHTSSIRLSGEGPDSRRKARD
ncbi:hypothetical protein E1N52_38485 [Paraburkholderia guartelaensis]|uniref:Uncharacterized protein n=1 Tax=Paraburkholderia guartelaensis TaxID=2546446 RepID=A0A4V2ZUW1_9BURK|nr:hypothetical protein [Paraburkholderia guartelaensis]TDG02693.1 hypothetical protein E1N52_38485 [Paraburkholderia guartelaensis]